MDDNNSVSGAQFGFNKTNTAINTQKDAVTSPVEDEAITTTISTIADDKIEEDNDTLNSSYTDNRSITISLVKNFSLYRKANDKVLPKKKDYIGGSVSASRTLSSNKEEIEAYFPNIIGLTPGNVDFVMRIKQYLNNIRIGVDELGKSFDISFVYNKKLDYYKIKAEEEKIENDYSKVNRQDLSKLKTALKDKIARLNVLESGKHKIGYPVDIEEYLMYRHCLLYGDVAKDIAFINSDSSIRFYFKDDQKEADKLRKFRTEINKAKTNYVSALADGILFDSIYTQYLVLSNFPVVSGLLEDSMIKETKLDKFSTEDPIKFNKMFTNRDVKLIGSIELLIAHGELQRSEFNQNISTAEGLFIGANMSEAVSWFKQLDNTSSVNAYFNKLKNI